MAFDLAAIGLIGGAATSIAGGIFGGRDRRDAEREQRARIREARSLFMQERAALDEGEALADISLDEADLILSDVEEDILGNLDEDMRIAVARQVVRQEQEAARTMRQLATAGLDATTVMPQVQRQQGLAQGDAMGAITAQFSGLRASAIQNARNARAQAAMGRAQYAGNFAAQRAGSYRSEANFVGGIPVQAPTTGADIGAIGGSIFGGLTAYQRQRDAADFRERLFPSNAGALGAPADPYQAALRAMGVGAPATGRPGIAGALSSTSEVERLQQMIASMRFN